jgi:SRSO17 transposase
MSENQRIFKIGATRIVADETMIALDHEAVRQRLKATYPEITHATIREREENGLQIVEFLPQPGRKG